MIITKEAFKPGDVVQIKSGGPAMTVIGYSEFVNNNSILCLWFTEAGELRNGVFFPEVLDFQQSTKIHKLKRSANI